MTDVLRGGSSGEDLRKVYEHDRRRKCSECALPMAGDPRRGYKWCVNPGCQLSWLKVWFRPIDKGGIMCVHTKASPRRANVRAHGTERSVSMHAERTARWKAFIQIDTEDEILEDDSILTNDRAAAETWARQTIETYVDEPGVIYTAWVFSGRMINAGLEDDPDWTFESDGRVEEQVT